MAFINEATHATTDPHTQRVYARQTRAFGYLPNYAPLFSHRPEVIDRWSDLQKSMRANMSVRVFELVTLAAAIALKSSYCALAHSAALRKEFSDKEIVGLVSGKHKSIVSEAEAAAMDYAAQVAKDANAVTISAIERLRKTGFSDAEIFDIAAVAAGRAFFRN
ncbi:MAG: peroxidase [Pseudomonadales bacterium]|nr:peroxidase [Pseudomonadales bacterium]